MRFDDLRFVFLFAPSLFAAYYLILAVGSLSRRAMDRALAATAWTLLAASLYFVSQGRFTALLLGMSAFAFSAAVLVDAVRGRPGISRPLLVAAVLVCLAAFVRASLAGASAVATGLAVVTCHAIAFLVDVHRREATVGRPLTAALYLLQFPTLPAGPILRYRDFAGHLARRNMGLGQFTYGVRRVVIGLVKVVLIARALDVPADRIFAMPAAKLSTDAAWLGAVCFSFQIYFQFSGYADVAVGLGRMLGFRFPENFRRPYTADSVRDFWRRWNITLITWLRDYLYLPIAGRDDPAPRLYLNIVAGFGLVGLWHGGGATVAAWAVYSGFWLAIEAIGLGVRLARLPALLRHVYLLGVVVVGWVIFRADTLAGAWTFLATMGGVTGLDAYTAGRYLTPSVRLALVLALVGAGPMVPAISRWRVSLDVAAASLLMMASAVGLFIWRGGTLLAASIRSIRPRG